MHAIEATGYGDSDVLELVEREPPDPGAGEVRIDVEAAGINFADVQQRRGHYPGGPEPPFVPGLEAAGTVDATGADVDLPAGQRVVAMTNGGAYAEYAVADARSVLPVPEGTSFREAAGFPLQFLTAHVALFDRGDLAAGERVLVHAAAGGVGTAAVQLAGAAGATVFGTASTDEKLALAAELGCEYPINYVADDFVDRVDEITDGEGVDLVLDGVGGDVFDDSLDALAPFGRLVFIGVASGDPPQADPVRLLFENKSVVGFHLGNAVRHEPARALGPVGELVEQLSGGDLRVVVGETFDLADAAAAHRFVENRESTGKVVLEP